MNVTLPVNMVPLSGRAATAGSFALAVIVGLALFMAARNLPQKPPGSTL